MVGHSDSVSSLCFRPEGFELVTCGHDGNLRIWDLRTYKCITDIACHMKKYDESVLCLSHNKEEALLAAGGADGLIKLLQPEH
jgi:WD40 repeat protein